ncbi:MAG: type I-F CRISPR-associated protein Csy2 [Sulfurovum sp.]|nr:type I-F CRISPR-associated protein Csy2 [Sulfurovum sp.]
MSQYLLLNRVKIQNANCIAGFTWGFPAITHFLGFTHHLHRQLSDRYGVSFSGCAVISHEYIVHAYKPYSDFEFIQSKNPAYLKKDVDKLSKGKTPSIIEEGKMNMTVSLVIELEKELVGNQQLKKEFEQTVKALCMRGRLAGGTILSADAVTLYGSDNDRKIKRALMPGFVLMDRSEALSAHFERLQSENKDAELLDAWLDFSALKYKAKPLVESEDEIPTEETKAEWELLPRPEEKGWLVPIMTGYKAISSLYGPGEVENVRDKEVPARFVEAVHSIGEWKAVFRLSDIKNSIWRYDVEDEWYLCKQNGKENISREFENQEVVNLDFEAALADI